MEGKNSETFRMESGRRFRSRVLAREYLAGTHTGIDSPILAGVMASTGFDFVWIDTEHSDVGGAALLGMISAVQAAGPAAIVRLPQHDLTATKHTLELGPDGVIFPMINTPEEADAAMRMTLYPPKGTRGFGPLRAANWGLNDVDGYIKNVDDGFCRFIQIESETAVKNLPEIIKNPYIDGYIFGPCDMSGSIGELNNVFGENTRTLIKRAVEILKAAGKCIGVSTGAVDTDVLAYWKELGINMISSGVDFGYVAAGARSNLANIRKLYR